MEILVKRRFKGSEYTIGSIFIDGVYIADTLEDPDRGLSLDMTLEDIKKKKIYGETAIPTGTYKVDMNTVSPKFKDRKWAVPYSGKIPRLVNVPGFEGVLIHTGTTALDSLGCLLVGKNTSKGMITSSQESFHKIMNILTSTKEDITIKIE